MSKRRWYGVTRLGASWAASVLLHAFMTGALGWAVAVHGFTHAPPDSPAPAPKPMPGPEADGLVPIDLPSTEGSLVASATPPPEGALPTPSGGSTVARLDTGHAGGGGASATERATNLADRDEQINLAQDLVSHLDRDQVQRLDTARDRASFEDRRATTRPMELTFVAFGDGATEERRAKAKTDPSRGVLRALPASVLGGTRGNPAAEELGAGAGKSGAARAGSTLASPGLGVHGATPGVDHRASASLVTAKPDVTQGKVSVPATEKDVARDDVDSEQQVAARVASIVHASTAGGAPGLGAGGTAGGGAPGAGGAGEGSRATPLGRGMGDWFDLDTSDPRLLPYFRKVKAKVQPLWSFPKSALADLKQGTVILEVTIAEDGAATVSWPPLRPSGIDEFDRNCADAVRKASPFEPIPKSLGVRTLHIRAPFSSTSPASWAP